MRCEQAEAVAAGLAILAFIALAGVVTVLSIAALI